MKGFSIIVCCYNSAALLPDTFSHLAALSDAAAYGMELILVDNCCTDDTAAVARKLWEGFGQPYPLKIVTESRPGLSFARECGIATARYDYFLFCDDDNWLSPEYVSRAVQILESVPGIGMLGGLGIPSYASIPPYWPRNFYIYGSGPQAPENGLTDKLHGAGVILLRKAFDRLARAEFRFCLTDRKGDQLSSGGDYELCYAVRMAGYHIWYDDTLRFSHFISADRLTPDYTRRFIRESAPAVDVLDIYSHLARHEKYVATTYTFFQGKYLLHHLRRLAWSVYLKARFSSDPQMVFLETFHQQYHLRRIVCIFRMQRRRRKVMREVRALGSRLAAIPMEQYQDSPAGS